MPRAFGWFVPSFLLIYLDDRALQRGHRGSHDRIQSHGQRVAATTVAPITLPYEPTKPL